MAHSSLDCRALTARLLVGAAALAVVPLARGDESAGYLLRYRFSAGEEIRWDVEHRANVRATVSGTTQTTESTTLSVKVWRVEGVDADGNATFMHSVEQIEMRQKLTGRQEVHYNSETDETPPPGFEDVARSVGVPLTQFVVSPLGKVLERHDKLQRAQPSEGQIMVQLPEDRVEVGDQWTYPYTLTARAPSGEVKRLPTRQLYTLEKVENGVATISLETQILAPIGDAAIEAQVVQYLTDGTVRFDIERGRMLAQQTDLDRNVVGFQGPASSMAYQTRVIERLASVPGPRSVSGPQPGPRAQTTSRPQTAPGAR